MKLEKYIYVMLFLGSFLFSNGQILKGGDISVNNVFGNTQQITARIAIEWPVTINKPYVKINWGDGSPLDSLQYGSSNCTLYSASTLEYYGTHAFAPNNTYTISIVDSFMVDSITNIPNSSSRKLNLRSILNTNYLPNKTPNIFGTCVTDSVPCCGAGSYNAGAFDNYGDSISYSLDAPINISDYIQPPVTLNSSTGTITFTKSTTGLTSVTLRIDEWRQISSVYYKISSTYQELLFKTFNPVGILENEFYNNNLSIYPNPTNSILNIIDEQNRLQNSTIEIKNPLGQVVFTTHFTTQINLSNFSTGIYFLTIKEKSNYKTVKIIKQ